MNGHSSATHLEAFEEEDVPDSQKVLEGQRVGEGRDEPVGAVHGGVHPLCQHVRPHRGQLVLHQLLELQREESGGIRRRLGLREIDAIG